MAQVPGRHMPALNCTLSFMSYSASHQIISRLCWYPVALKLMQKQHSLQVVIRFATQTSRGAADVDVPLGLHSTGRPRQV